MANIFLCSDHHFGHENSFAKFKRHDGTPLRPYTDVDEMNEDMIAKHNAVVKPNDKVYFLGDVVINKKYLHLVQRMNGLKRLVRGNHDIFDDQLYRDVGFDAIYGSRVLSGLILTHIPIHSESIGRFGANIHGHLHANEVMLNRIPDPRYLCVCVEHTDFGPISLEDAKALIQKRQDACGYKPPKDPWGNGSNPG